MNTHKLAGPRRNQPFGAMVRAYETAGAPDRLVNRPADVPADAIALRIAGDCLAPRARSGQIAFVEPRLPEVGDMAAFWFKVGGEPVIKILCTPIYHYPHNANNEIIQIVEAEQLNPPLRYSAGMDQIECIARVVRVINEGECDDA